MCVRQRRQQLTDAGAASALPAKAALRSVLLGRRPGRLAAWPAPRRLGQVDNQRPLRTDQPGPTPRSCAASAVSRGTPTRAAAALRPGHGRRAPASGTTCPGAQRRTRDLQSRLSTRQGRERAAASATPTPRPPTPSDGLGTGDSGSTDHPATTLGRGLRPRETSGSVPTKGSEAVTSSLRGRRLGAWRESEVADSGRSRAGGPSGLPSAWSVRP